MSACEIGSQCGGKFWLKKRGLKLVLIDYTLPLLLTKFWLKNHASNIHDFTVYTRF